MSNKNRKLLIASLLTSLFLFSVIVRLHNLNRPLSLHHEGGTAGALVNQRTWYEEGGLKYAFCLVMNYPNKADKNINNSGRQKDKEGNYYYTSMPPFAGIFAHFIFKLLHIYPDVLPLQILNLTLHFISGVFIYLIIALLTNRYYLNRLNIPAILGFSVYLFSAATMWYQSNVYFSLDLPLFIIGIYTFLKFMGSKNKKLVYYFLIGLINFFIIYSSWFGLFFAATVCLYTLVKLKRKEMRILLFVISITSLAPIALTVWQYSQINGFHDFINTIMGRYKVRSGLTSNGLSYFELLLWEKIVFHYINNYAPILITLYTFAWLYFIRLKVPFTKDILSNWKNEIITLYLSATPVIFNHLIFFKFTSVHDYSVLQSIVFIAIFTALLYHKLVYTIKSELDEKKAKIIILNSFVVLMILSSILQYIVINRKRDESFKNIGEEIARIQKLDEVIFIKTENYRKDGWVRDIKTPPNQIIFYAHRNIAVWESESAAKELLKLNDVERGVIFTLDPENTQIINIAYVDR